MKDAHQEFINRPNGYRARFESLSQCAQNENNFTEARINLECAVKLSDHILTVESLMGQGDDEVILATDDEKLS